MSIQKLKKYALDSKLMDITIAYGEEVFKFNLGNEVNIEEDFNREELLKQPAAYAFLTTLHKKLITKLSRQKVAEKKAWAVAYLKYKDKTNPVTGKPYSDDVCKAKAELNEDYLNSQGITIKIQHNVSIIESCVRAFENRKDLLQTLSANARSQTD